MSLTLSPVCLAAVKLNGGRQIEGVLRGFDPFMNLVLDESLEVTKSGQRSKIGMVVSGLPKKRTCYITMTYVVSDLSKTCQIELIICHQILELGLVEFGLVTIVVKLLLSFGVTDQPLAAPLTCAGPCFPGGSRQQYHHDGELGEDLTLSHRRSPSFPAPGFTLHRCIVSCRNIRHREQYIALTSHHRCLCVLS